MNGEFGSLKLLHSRPKAQEPMLSIVKQAVKMKKTDLKFGIIRYIKLFQIKYAYGTVTSIKLVYSMNYMNMILIGV